MPRPVALVLVGAVAVALLAGCSEGSDAYNGNLPDDQAQTRQQRVVQTPAVVAPDLPYSTPPLLVPLPGPTGGLPGDVPTAAAPASPGEGQRAEQDQE